MARPDDSEFHGEAVPSDDVFRPGGTLRMELLTPHAADALQQALRLALETRWDSLRSPHVFMGLLADPDPCISDWGIRLRADLPRLLSQFQELFQQDDLPPESLHLHREFLSDNVLRLLRDAYHRTRKSGRARVTPMDLLISLLSAENSIVADCFERIGIPAKTLTRLAVEAEDHRGGADRRAEA